MKIAIIVAMEKELALLLPLIMDKKTRSIDGKEVNEGRLGNHDVVVVLCGIGKVNAALSTYALIRAECPDMVINTGVCGGADIKTGICDVLVADEVAYHDVWCGPETEYGAACGLPARMECDRRTVEKAREVLTGGKVHFGLLCSGDKFICKPEEVVEIKVHFPDALGVDMESGAIAQTCLREGVPFVIVRAISDTPGSGHNIEQYEGFWENAPQSTFHTLLRLLEQID